MGITKRREALEREGKKLTGRELFMTDKTLDQSDLKFLDDGTIRTVQLGYRFVCKKSDEFWMNNYVTGDAVKVDESLFQNLEDLDLDDDDDPDFDPNNLSDDSA